MNLKSNIVAYRAIILFALIGTSCDYHEDPGPLQEVEEHYSIVDFDRLEMGDAFNVTVTQGDYFDVSVRGDRRNVNDLVVRKEGSTLVIRFDEHRNRRHNTYINITMPEILAANFSGASDSRITGFENGDRFDLILSGASVCQLDFDLTDLRITLSGASYLNARGVGEHLRADLSGASVLKAFNYFTSEADVTLSGASDAHVTVSTRLGVVATGASVLTYRGNPEITSDVSGSSAVRQD